MAQTEATRQIVSGFWLQGDERTHVGATADGNGNTAYVDGYNGALMVEIIETGGGTCHVDLVGSMSGPWDGTTAFAFKPGTANDTFNVGYVPLAVAPRAVAVTQIAVTANSRKAYMIVDAFSSLRAVVSSSAGGSNVIVRLRMLAQ